MADFKSPVQGKGWSTRATGDASSATPNAARVELQPCMLQPPAGGLAVYQIMAQRPLDGSPRVVHESWIRELAARVRAAEVSPERALLSAYMLGEVTGLCSKIEPPP